MFSTLVENVNMQMEAETADMIDRRMMQLYAVAHEKLEKGDVQNATANLGLANRNQGKTDLYGTKMLKKIHETGIPELGLKGLKEMQSVQQLNSQASKKRSLKNRIGSLPTLNKRFH
jgi:hypothetical protein